MTPPPKRPAAASPQGATLADRRSRIRGVCLTPPACIDVLERLA